MSHFKEHSSRYAAILDEVTKIFLRCSLQNRKTVFIVFHKDITLFIKLCPIVTSLLFSSDSSNKIFLQPLIFLYFFRPFCSAEQGILVLVVQFLNLVTGAHSNSKIFWTEVLPDAMCQRFGNIILQQLSQPHRDFNPEVPSKPSMSVPTSDHKVTNTSYQSHGQDLESVQKRSKEPIISLWDWCSGDHTFLFSLLPQLCSMTGINLSMECQRQLADFEDQFHRPQRDQTGPMNSYTLIDSTHNVTNISDNYQFHNSGSRTYHTSNQKQHQHKHTAHFEFVMADVTEILPVSSHSLSIQKSDVISLYHVIIFTIECLILFHVNSHIQI